MVRAYFAATMKVEELRVDHHMLVYDDFNDTENTACLLALQDALFSRNRIFSYALEAQNSNTVEFRFVGWINYSISRYKNNIP
jgi:hypothetical protein